MSVESNTKEKGKETYNLKDHKIDGFEQGGTTACMQGEKQRFFAEVMNMGCWGVVVTWMSGLMNER